MRLIDTDAIKLPEGFFEKVDNVPKFYDWLNSLPTIDAVEVVLCKDCKFKNYYLFPPKYDKKCYCENHGKIITEIDYCSWAERRTDATFN